MHCLMKWWYKMMGSTSLSLGTIIIIVSKHTKMGKKTHCFHVQFYKIFLGRGTSPNPSPWGVGTSPSPNHTPWLGFASQSREAAHSTPLTMGLGTTTIFNKSAPMLAWVQRLLPYSKMVDNYPTGSISNIKKQNDECPVA